MEDLFGREQQILDDAVQYVGEIQSGVPCEREKFEDLTREYGRLLKQVRRITKLSDRTTIDLNASKLELLEKVNYDALTGIYNRRYLEERLAFLMKSLSRTAGLPHMLSVLMIDIDFFKKYNDTYGHSMGDQCLKLVAEALQNTLSRTDDFVARYGGEEFIVVLPNTGKEGACLVADKLLQAVRVLDIPHEKNTPVGCVTISVGVTTGAVQYTQQEEDYIKCADKALYTSKQSGRNQYTFADFEEGDTR